MIELQDSAIDLHGQFRLSSQHQSKPQQQHFSQHDRQFSLDAVEAAKPATTRLVLGDFAVTRLDIGSFRQLKTTTKTNEDYCRCFFEQDDLATRDDTTATTSSLSVWICLACGGPALEIPQRWIRHMTYTPSTRLLRLALCESPFETLSWRPSRLNNVSTCKDPTGGELEQSLKLDLYLSRLVDSNVVQEMVRKVSAISSDRPVTVATPNHIVLASLGSSQSTEFSPLHSPAGTLSPSLSEETLWTSSCVPTPDRFVQQFHYTDSRDEQGVRSYGNPTENDDSFDNTSSIKHPHPMYETHRRNSADRQYALRINNGNRNQGFMTLHRSLQLQSPQSRGCRSPTRSSFALPNRTIQNRRRPRRHRNRHNKGNLKDMESLTAQLSAATCEIHPKQLKTIDHYQHGHKPSDRNIKDNSQGNMFNSAYSQQYRSLVKRLQEKVEAQQSISSSAMPETLDMKNNGIVGASCAEILSNPATRVSRHRCISESAKDSYPSRLSPIPPAFPNLSMASGSFRALRRLSCTGRMENPLENMNSQHTAIGENLKQERTDSSHSHSSSKVASATVVVGGYKAKASHLTISTSLPDMDSLRDTAMSSVSFDGDRRTSISSTSSDLSTISTTVTPRHSSVSSSMTCSNPKRTKLQTIEPRKGGPPVHYTLMCWIGGRWPCKLRPLSKKSNFNDIQATLRRNLKLPHSYFIDIEFQWNGQTYMLLDCAHWQWAREQVHHGDMSIRCNIWQKRFTP